MATVVAAAAAGSLAGSRGLVSAALGGGVCVLPNVVFALRLKRAAKRPGSAFTVYFLVGELIKLVLAIGLLVVVVKTYADVHWPSLLGGLVLATQAMFFAFWKKN